MVRAAVAINDRCGPEVERILAGDGDDRIRALLAARIARLLPELSTDEHESAARHVRTVLAGLARDQATKVRAAIAEEVKAMPEAPHELVWQLARDHDPAVSDPVLLLSPVLTDADLILLLATPPHRGAGAAIASRPGLSAAVTDVIATHADGPAIRALLANHSACIQEATLDALIGRAAWHNDWHAPLVEWPHLSAKAVRTLSEFVARHLLETLAKRPDLDAANVQAVRDRLAGLAAHRSTETEGDPLAEYRLLQSGNALDEHVLLEAANRGDLPRLAAALAVASGVSLRTVERAVALRSAKALVSLAWRSGFSMRAATVVQAVLGQLGPASILPPGSDDAFPLSQDEMEWQIELLTTTPEVSAGPGPGLGAGSGAGSGPSRIGMGAPHPI